MTYTDFQKNFANIMQAAGYEKIDIPAYEPWSGRFCLWGKISGAMAYFYAVYEAHTAGIAGFAGLKEAVDRCAAAIAQRFDMRHTVIFNIFAGDLSGDVREIEKMIDGQGEFMMMSKYDVYYGADTAGLRILRNTGQPHNLDGALAKIQRALKGTGVAAAPSRFAQPVAKHPILCYGILAINALIFLLMELSGGSTDTATLIRFGAVSYHLVFTFGEYHRLVTPIFLHIGFMHLIFNTLSMTLFGMRAERYFGHVKFLVIYFASGIAGNLAMALASEHALGAGASGAIYGMIGALFAFTILRKQNVENFRAGVLGVMIAVGILMGFTMNQIPDMPNVGNAAHIGGLVVGLVLGYVLAGKGASAEVAK
ncbi:MAG: rhomboid family intramembrane serine protease [Clostridiales bacterium]|jgi:membrane associated rhomboid family serine protease|nr:rhomboid family intramembrane serine protease [Clostridiales bacterium]